jgi:hypothetical protein
LTWASADGEPEFAARLPEEALEVRYEAAEREGHALLAAYTALRTGSPRRNEPAPTYLVVL